MSSKTISQWEQEKNFVLKPEYIKANKIDVNKKVSETDFDAIEHHQKHHIDYEPRVKFLTDNGFEVTRETLIDHRLSTGHLIRIDGEFLDYDDWKSKQA